MARSPFLGGTYQLPAKQAAASRLVNLYPEMIEDPAARESRAVGYFTHCPGFTAYATLTGAVRGLHVASNGVLYAVAGATLYSVVGGVATSLGTLSTSSGPVSMVDNRLQLAIVDGTAGYTLTFSSNAFATIADADFPNGAHQIVYQDTYGIVIDPDTQRFYISSQNDFTTWDALDFASAEGAPDDAIALISDHRELWIFGESSAEVFYNSGAADFPFERVAGATIEHGCAAVHSVAKLDNTVFWLGQDSNGTGVVWRADGYRPQRVSTHAIEYLLAEDGALSVARAWTYQQAGHSFYVLSITDRALVYDASTGLWHERAGFLAGTYTTYPATCHAAYEGKNIVGTAAGTLYELDNEAHTYGSQERRWLRSWRHANSEMSRVIYHRLTLDARTGEAGGQVMLRWSDDGGNTWSNEQWASLGAIGEYATRVDWRRLGAGRDRVFEVSGADAVAVELIGAYVEATRARA